MADGGEEATSGVSAATSVEADATSVVATTTTKKSGAKNTHFSFDDDAFTVEATVGVENAVTAVVKAAKFAGTHTRFSCDDDDDAV